MKQLRLTDPSAGESHDDNGRPFLTDDAIGCRLEEIEASLREIILSGHDRPFAAVGRAADDLHRLVRDLLPEATQ